MAAQITLNSPEWEALKGSQYQLFSPGTKILLQQTKILSKTSLTCDSSHVKSFYCYSCLLIMTVICVKRLFSSQICLTYFYFQTMENAGCTQYLESSFVSFIVLWCVTHWNVLGQKETLGSGLKPTHCLSRVTSDNTGSNLACPGGKSSNFGAYSSIHIMVSISSINCHTCTFKGILKASHLKIIFSKVSPDGFLQQIDY